MENLQCDLCDQEFPVPEIFHFSGILQGQASGHVHVCAGCVQKFELGRAMIDFDRLLGK